MSNQNVFPLGVLPWVVYYDNNLTCFARVLFDVILSKGGYSASGCHTSNAEFAKDFQVAEATVSRAVSALKEAGYITTALRGRSNRTIFVTPKARNK